MQTFSQREKFRQDALRWVIPGQVAEESDLTMGVLLKLLIRHMPLRAMAWFRFACWCQEKRIPGIFGVIIRWIYFRFGLEIWGDIGGGLYIAHPIGAVVAVNRMGQNCSMIASVTLGMRNKPIFPTIGDDVFIGAGARVLGDVSIGNGAKVGANAVVVHDVDAGATVVGIPAKPLPAKAPTPSIDDVSNNEAAYENGQIREVVELA